MPRSLPRMDPLGGLLSGPRARGAFVVRTLLAAPWSIEIQDEARLSVHLSESVDTAGLTVPDKTGPTHTRELLEGAIALVRGPGHYRLADRADRRPQVVVHPDQSCTTLDGTPVSPIGAFGVRTWGNDADGPTEIVSGTYLDAGEVSRAVLDALPEVVVPTPGDWSRPLIDLLATASQSNEPGQQVVLDRILDLLLIATLRAWFDQPENAPGWYRGHQDPVVAQAVGLIHAHPEKPWTVDALARASGMSRASFARRFTGLIGRSPMLFLADWRLTLAADLLLNPGNTLAAVARQVGYSTPFALSNAFKRARGISPREWVQKNRPSVEIAS